MSVPIKFPSIISPVPLAKVPIPSPLFPEITLRAAATVPPIVTFVGPQMKTPPDLLPRGLVPVASVPIRFPWMARLPDPITKQSMP